MNTRSPIFLSLAGAIPVIWVGFLLIAALLDKTHPIAMGGAPPDIQAAIRNILFAIGGSCLIGLTMSVISLLRGERWRELGWISFCIYLLPALLGLWVILWDILHPTSKTS